MRLPPLLVLFLGAALACACATEPARPAQATSAPLPPLPASPHYRVWHTGSTHDFVPGAERPTRAGLLLKGGGGDAESAWRWFVDCAAGGDVVVLRTFGGDGYQDYLYREIGGLASVTTIRFEGAEASHDPALLARLASAEAIFLAGGDQAQYLRYWRGTPLAAALGAHLAAGKPLGGTSAGLAVLGEFAYSADHPDITSERNLRSAEALADPFDPLITLDRGLLPIARLSGLVTDTHFSERERLGRLAVFLARLRAERPEAPRLVGLGVDEATALCVEPEGLARVHATKGGAVWLVQLEDVATLQAGRPLEAAFTARAVPTGGVVDLRTLEVAPPVPVRRLRASAGRVEDAP
jgi:cyanophycinase